MAKTGAEVCSDAWLMIDGIATDVDVFIVDAFSTEVGGVLIAFCVAFTKRLGLIG